MDFQPVNPYNLVTKLFQLTELVYMAIVANQRAAPSTKEDIIATYQKCLVWYSELFELVENGSSRSPFILFLHMYYHFYILCTFRPFVGSDFAPSEVQPHEMCVQAAQSILILAQSYDDLFTLQRVPAWIPYFVCASGLFGLAIEDSRADRDFSRLLYSQDDSIVRDQKFDGGPGPASAVTNGRKSPCGGNGQRETQRKSRNLAAVKRSWV
ncbi:Fungal transcriptional regulatory protein [Beauveria brongniartii RCEF 3172]|uniref:Fungal transcriptional regulatory protein n=1 Tax=Beauveria brongniartii RCEF 3172 TaxID=1081107 RepID=A0A166WJJ1_9HYPO|nr:Fungal transcriptional regulatory protein [Beauveria brongniartii RCEF 3172]